MSFLADIARRVALHGALVRVTVIAADGSTPREAGAVMLVWSDRTEATIGGGALELDAIAVARAMLAGDHDAPWLRAQRSYPLGPALGQCCGGYAKLLFERFESREVAILEAVPEAADAGLVVRPLAAGVAPGVMSSRKEASNWPLPVLRLARQMLSGERPRRLTVLDGRKGQGDWLIEPEQPAPHQLVLYGAGHVGRAVVRALDGLPFAITWVDSAPERFPETVPSGVVPLVAGNPAAVAALAPPDAHHVIMTYSHALDLAICHAVLSRGAFAWLGLIGSATKRARFAKRLREAGIADAELARMVCPIGVPGLMGKEPAVIAIAVAAQLIGVGQGQARLRRGEEQMG